LNVSVPVTFPALQRTQIICYAPGWIADPQATSGYCKVACLWTFPDMDIYLIYWPIVGWLGAIASLFVIVIRISLPELRSFPANISTFLLGTQFIFSMSYLSMSIVSLKSQTCPFPADASPVPKCLFGYITAAIGDASLYYWAVISVLTASRLWSNKPIVQFFTWEYQVALHSIIGLWVIFKAVTPIALGQLKFGGIQQCFVVTGNWLYWILWPVYALFIGIVAGSGLAGIILYSLFRAESIMVLWKMKRLLAIITSFLFVLVSLLLATFSVPIYREQLSSSLEEYYKCLVLTPSCARSASSMQPLAFVVLFCYVVSAAPIWFSLIYLIDSSTIRALQLWRQSASSSLGLNYSKMADQNDDDTLKDLQTM